MAEAGSEVFSGGDTTPIAVIALTIIIFKHSTILPSELRDQNLGKQGLLPAFQTRYISRRASAQREVESAIIATL